MKKIAVAAAFSLIATAAFAINFEHPNLKDANDAVQAAIHHIELAQTNNKGVEFGGHAENAIHALQQAQKELEAAEAYRDSHKK